MFSRLRVLFTLSATVIAPTFVHAVDMGNIEVQSAIDEPFRAKIPLSNVKGSLNNLKLNTASSSEYSNLGMEKANVSLNYRIQDNGDGTGVLWVSSSQPVRDPFLDIVVNVDDNNSTKQHQVSAMINPSTLGNPTNNNKYNNTLATNRLTTKETPLIPIQSAPPPLLPSPNVNLPKIDAPVAVKKLEPLPKPVQTPVLPPRSTSNTNTTVTNSAPKPPVFTDNTVRRLPEAIVIDNPYSQKSVEEAVEKYRTKGFNTLAELNGSGAKPTIKPTEPNNTVTAASVPATPINTDNSSNATYTVVKRDTLWDIAKKVSIAKNIPISTVMDSIKAANQNAFINNNPNRLRSGVSLSIPQFTDSDSLEAALKPTATQPATNTKIKKKVAKKQALKAAKTTKKANKKSKKSTKKAKKTSAKKQYQAKKRLNKISKPITSKTTKKATKKYVAKKKPVKKTYKASKPKFTKPKKQTNRLAQSEMRIVAPNNKGKAQGESKAKSKNTKSSKLPPQIVSQIKKSRKATINKRKKINKLNAELSSYNKKIKLQNSKLAELEMRLKQLKKKKSQKAS